MSELLKKNNAITLIALVITIIILIILAGISIAILTGEDGLITKAKLGAQNYQNAAIEEQSMLNTIGIYTELNGDTNGHGTNIKTKEATTITPGTEDIVIPAGTYLSGDLIIKGNSNLVAENIKEGVEIFDVEGTATSETTHTESYTIPENAADLENIDLGINHNIRYINASNTYTAGTSAPKTVTLKVVTSGEQGHWISEKNQGISGIYINGNLVTGGALQGGTTYTWNVNV